MTAAVKQHDELMFEEFDYETELDIQIRDDAEKHMRLSLLDGRSRRDQPGLRGRDPAHRGVSGARAIQDRQPPVVARGRAYRLSAGAGQEDAEDDPRNNPQNGWAVRRIEITDKYGFLEWAKLKIVADLLTTTLQ